MNPELNASIEPLVNALPESDRAQAREILGACEFQGARDPHLGLLLYQQLRTRAQAAAERPLARELAVMAEELDNRLYEARRLKLGLIAGCLGLALLIGGLLVGAAVLYAARVNPDKTAAALRLPVHREDERLTLLDNGGVRLRVQAADELVGVGLTGTIERVDKKSNGEVVLLFRKSP